MSDSAALHLTLFEAGHCRDKYGNTAFPCFAFDSPEAAAEYRGQPELWQAYLLEPQSLARLRSVWVQDWGADDILADTGRLFGWNPELMGLGYSLDLDGVDMKYDQVLQQSEPYLFSEIHFTAPAGARA